MGDLESRRVKASLRDIAKAANVSVSTVSRYLSGQLTLKDDTQKRVKSALLDAGYRDGRSNPLPSVNRLTATIGLLIPHTANSYYGRLADAVVRAADEQGLYVILLSTLSNPTRQVDYLELATSLGLGGLVYAGNYRTNDALAKVVASGIPTVLIDEDVDGIPPTDKVLIDDYAGAYQAVTYLCSQGHRSIALLTGPEELRSSRERRRAYGDVLTRHGVQPSDQFMMQGSFTEAFGAAAFARAIAAEDRPTAIFAASDVIALGVISAAASFGISIPSEISLVGFDDIPEARLVLPHLTTVRTPLAEISTTAITLLRARMAGADRPSETVMISANLEIRGSVTSQR
ncbi:LacI family DNA-binding transcriptional regulator [Devosia rhodophyticola]|uniref:LacI family DNA-binding transcriptional regulator n=1 Tax=Devosia rhodophyticola TaxID=3026423 RepID=A0ABY7Z049_9HYPH|nr:LacI family DNA-binding transcriptional regulator [Devosia rhodophyticola]WDR06956.1 LacI family DNA-binding transcriptional regulator [Devosia rhodophyticola]